MFQQSFLGFSFTFSPLHRQIVEETLALAAKEEKPEHLAAPPVPCQDT